MDEDLLHDRSNLDKLRTLQDVLATTENSLATSERRYRYFVQNSNEGIWRYELEKGMPLRLSVEEQIDWFYKYGWLAEANDAMAKQYGYESAVELIGSRLAEVLPPELEGTQEYLTRFIECGYDLHAYESQEVDKDGNPKYFLNSLKGEIEDGKLQRAWGTQIDITEKVKLRKDLAYRMELYEAILANVMDIIKISDLTGTIQYASPSHLDALQYESSELVGRNLRDFIHPDDYEITEPVLQKAVSGGVSDIVSFRMKRKDGRWIKVEGMARGIPEGGHTTTILTIAWRSKLRQFRLHLNDEEPNDE